MRRAVRLVILCAVVVPMPGTGIAGERMELAAKVFGAQQVIEVRLPLTEPIPARWPTKTYDPNGQAFPDVLIAHARKAATVERVIRWPPDQRAPQLPERWFVVSTNSACWWKAHQRGSLRTLVFLSDTGRGTLQPVFGVEHEQGLYTDLNPTYDRLVAAIVEASSWHEERMRAVGASELWQKQRAALKSDNPYLQNLAAAWLRTHGGSNVIDELWGPSGSKERRERELAAREPYQSFCKP